MRRFLLLACVLGLLHAGCSSPPPPPVMADGLTAAVQALHDSAEHAGICVALKAAMTPDAMILAPAPIPASMWECTTPPLPLTPHLIEVAANGDFGFSASSWDMEDTHAWLVAAWSLQPDSVWRANIAAVTEHPGSVLPSRLVPRAGLGWTRATRPLYQEAARVSMLKADRDIASTSMDTEMHQALARVLSDSVLHLSAGHASLRGYQAAVAQIGELSGMVTWVPISGAMASAGDLGYTYGLQTIRPNAQDTTLTTRAYLRIWRSYPDSTWKLVVNVLARAAEQANGDTLGD